MAVDLDADHLLVGTEARAPASTIGGRTIPSIRNGWKGSAGSCRSRLRLDSPGASGLRSRRSRGSSAPRPRPRGRRFARKPCDPALKIGSARQALPRPVDRDPRPAPLERVARRPILIRDPESFDCDVGLISDLRFPISMPSIHDLSGSNKPDRESFRKAGPAGLADPRADPLESGEPLARSRRKNSVDVPESPAAAEPDRPGAPAGRHSRWPRCSWRSSPGGPGGRPRPLAGHPVFGHREGGSRPGPCPIRGRRGLRRVPSRRVRRPRPVGPRQDAPAGRPEPDRPGGRREAGRGPRATRRHLELRVPRRQADRSSDRRGARSIGRPSITPSARATTPRPS